jgi:hypothetical protein
MHRLALALLILAAAPASAAAAPFGELELAVAISGERRFRADEISASAEYAEELRAVARAENDAFWAAAREAAEHARSAREDARRRAGDAAQLSEILQSEESPGGL